MTRLSLIFISALALYPWAISAKDIEEKFPPCAVPVIGEKVSGLFAMVDYPMSRLERELNQVPKKERVHTFEPVRELSVSSVRYHAHLLLHKPQNGVLTHLGKEVKKVYFGQSGHYRFHSSRIYAMNTVVRHGFRAELINRITWTPDVEPDFCVDADQGAEVIVFGVFGDEIPIIEKVDTCDSVAATLAISDDENRCINTGIDYIGIKGFFVHAATGCIEEITKLYSPFITFSCYYNGN